MFSFCSNRHKIYQEDYNKYVYIDQKVEIHKLTGKKCEYISNICNLWLFKSEVSSDQSFIVVPSLFNSPEILFFNQEQNYIDYLTLFGDVYLLEWKETTENLKLSDYANCTANVVKFIKTQNSPSKSVNLVGHCIGGNIAIFSTFIEKNIASLTLLTTPWDYSHFTQAFLLSECLEMKKAIKDLQNIPKIYVQMMFFMLFRESYETKIAKYFALDAAREKYLRIEHWLQSGIDIPSSLYNEILDDIILKNALVTKDFYINNNLVSLEQINIPTFIVSAEEDQLVPTKSIALLQKEIKNSTLISVEGGHIGYLINNDQKFKDAYRKWFTMVSSRNL